MTKTRQAGAEAGMQLARARRWSAWQEAAGALTLAAVVGFWGAAVAGLAAPLGSLLASLEAERVEAHRVSGPPPVGPRCDTPPDVIAAVAVRPSGDPCR